CRSSPTTYTRFSAKRAPVTPSPDVVMTVTRGHEPPGMPVPAGMLDENMSRRGTSPVLIGRGEQMAALAAAFTAVRHGGPSAVLVGGEAGVGKSRLASEFTDAARRRGARILAGGCLELGADGLPFGPF